MNIISQENSKNKIKSIIVESIGKESYWIVNKKLSSHIGMYPAILLSELVSKDAYHTTLDEKLDGKYFYHKAETIESNLYISSDLRRKYTNILQIIGIIDVVTRGLPAKHYYSINYDKIADYMAKDFGTQKDRDDISYLIKSKSEKKQDVDKSETQEVEKSNLLILDETTKEAEKSNINTPNDSTSINNNKDNTKEDNNKGGEEKKSIAHNHEDTGTTDEPTIPPTIPPEVQKDIDDNNRLLAEFKARQSQELEPPPPPQVVARVEDLLTTSNQFIQSIGFGFTRNPRHILDAIYKQLPEDYQIKEDPKDIELVKSAINQYESSPPSERDALAKKFYSTVENMAKLYLIKKHGEEFRDKLYPEILNKNLIMYLNCNPTFKYCHGGFSNDIDGVYAEITRIVRKKAEKREQEEQREEEKRIERERVRELMTNRPHYSDEEIHAMGLKTMSEILESSRNKGSEVDLLDEKYKPVAPLSDKDRLREEELLKIMISGQRLNGEEQAEFDYLRRKKVMGIV